ncbi:hypothetical protein F1542_12040 [Komagataeibacter sp. FXV3]|nr:hypothetical protein [Komagataeibacter sp. FXV3]
MARHYAGQDRLDKRACSTDDPDGIVKVLRKFLMQLFSKSFRKRHLFEKGDTQKIFVFIYQ